MNASKAVFGDLNKDKDNPSIEDVIESLRDLDYRIEEIAEQTEKLPTEKRDH